MSSFTFLSSFSRFPASPTLVVPPEALLAFILIVPAGIAFALVSLIFKNEDEGVDDPHESLPTLRVQRFEYVEISIPCGLEEVLIDMIPRVKYTWKDASNACIICLSPFEEDEPIKVLPECKHAFHGPCIDRWFESYSTCPLCRKKVTLQTIETHKVVCQ